VEYTVGAVGSTSASMPAKARSLILRNTCSRYSAAKVSTALSRAPAMVISRVTGWIESGEDASRSRITR
jgi:hypothetical protein